MIAGGVLVLSFIPDIILLTSGGSLIEVGAYMLMHIVTAVICVVGLAKFTQTTNAI
jgi:membrane protein DedA with SNARE-associated domain